MGKQITPIKYDEVKDFFYGTARVKLDGKWGLINKTGREVIPYQFDLFYYEFDSKKRKAFVSVDANRFYLDKL